jgi:hypothetical protein
MKERVHIKTARIVAAAALIVAGGFAPHGARAQQGVKRTDLQQHDLGISGREAIQVRVDIARECWRRDTRISVRRSSVSSKERWNTCWKASRR